MEFKNILALIITISLILILGFVIIFPFVSGLQGAIGNDDIMMKYLDKTASLITGILGIIIGYYFGQEKTTDNKH